jgi:hypothetical protein
MSLEDACKYMTFCLKNEESILKTYTEKHKEIEIELHQKALPIPVSPSVMPKCRQ